MATRIAATALSFAAVAGSTRLATDAFATDRERTLFAMGAALLLAASVAALFPGEIPRSARGTRLAAAVAGLLIGLAAAVLPALAAARGLPFLEGDPFVFGALLAAGIWVGRGSRIALWLPAALGLAAGAWLPALVLPASPMLAGVSQPLEGSAAHVAFDASGAVTRLRDPLDGDVLFANGRALARTALVARAERLAASLPVLMAASRGRAVLVGPAGEAPIDAAREAGARRVSAILARRSALAALGPWPGIRIDPPGGGLDASGAPDAIAGCWPFLEDPVYRALVSPSALFRWARALAPGGVAGLLVLEAASGSRARRETERAFAAAFPRRATFDLGPGEGSVLLGCKAGPNAPCAAPGTRRPDAAGDEAAAAGARASGNLDAAIARARVALTIDPGSGWARAALATWLLERGISRLRTGKTAGARADLADALPLLDEPAMRERAERARARANAR
jgi:hypothetical protein